MKLDGVKSHFTVPVLFYLVNLFLISPAFFLNLGEINPWDEAAYLNGGRVLLEGNLPSFADNPLIRVFYGLTYILFRSSPYWMLHSVTAGRFVLFTLLWISTFLVATRLSRWSQPMIMVGMFFVTPLAIDLFRFPSDPLFASLAGLSFWQLLLFRENGGRKHVWLASFFMGLAALARNDGLVLIAILVFLSVVLSISGRHRMPADRWWVNIAPSLVPFLVMVGGYLLLYGLVTGDFELGTGRRTYENFEAGHLAIYGGTGSLNPVIEAKLEAGRVFGSPEENGYSVFRAIRRNPAVYLQRVVVVMRGLPQELLHAYGIRFAVLLFVLAGRGIIELLRQKQYTLLLLFALWPSHLATGFVITIFRQGHLRFSFYILFALASIGLAAALRNVLDRRELFGWSAVLLGIAIYGYSDNKLAIYYGVSVFLAAFLSIYVIKRLFGESRNLEFIILLVVLCSGVVIRGNFPSPQLRPLGVEAKEQALLNLVENFPPGSKIAAGSPGVVWAAKMTYFGLASGVVPTSISPKEFIDWMIDNDVQGVYVDHTLYNDNPVVWDLIKPRIGQGVNRIFVGDQGDIQVLVLGAN